MQPLKTLPYSAYPAIMQAINTLPYLSLPLSCGVFNPAKNGQVLPGSLFITRVLILRDKCQVVQIIDDCVRVFPMYCNKRTQY